MTCIYLKDGTRLNLEIVGDPTKSEFLKQLLKHEVEPPDIDSVPLTREKIRLYDKLNRKLFKKRPISKFKISSLLE
jgi:hypothetical protein